jgi:2-(1,2-epoxy-1,2-dihydrophenyl)acetyl-CoA isomerase
MLVERCVGGASDSIAHVVLGDDVGNNAFSLVWAQQFAAAVTTAVEDSAAGVILITSSARRFSVGGDLRSLASANDAAETMAGLVDAMHQPLKLLHDVDKAVVVAVGGACAGGGLGIVLAADIVVAEPDAVFIPGYPRLGLTPDCGVSAWLPRVMGLRRALAFSLAPEGWAAHEAREAGLVTEVSPVGESLGRAVAWAKLIAGQGVSAGLTRQLLRRAMDTEPERQMDEERESIVMLAQTEGFQATLQARFVT